MGSALISESSSLGWSTGWDIVLRSWARHITLTVHVPLSTQLYKLAPTNLVLELTLQWTTSHPREYRNIPSRFMLQEQRYAPAGVMGH